MTAPKEKKSFHRRYSIASLNFTVPSSVCNRVLIGNEAIRRQLSIFAALSLQVKLTFKYSF